MKVSRLLNESTMVLKEYKIEDPAYEAGLLLSWALGRPVGYVYSYPDKEVEESTERLFLKVIDRRAKGEPYQYIIGECEFMSLKFRVDNSVLIPRSDTEILAEAALYALGCNMPYVDRHMFRLTAVEGSRSVLDIGTGSGCLAVSIARYAENVRVQAIDISEGALNIARENAATNGVADKIKFFQTDYRSSDCNLGSFDLVVSNPPYITDAEMTELMPSVKAYEPHTALYGGPDGLDFYRKMALDSVRLLNRDGIIAVECGYSQAGNISGYFSEQGLQTVILKDLAGIDRVVAGRRI